MKRNAFWRNIRRIIRASLSDMTTLPDPRTLVDCCPECETPYGYRLDACGNRIREMCKGCISDRVPAPLPDSGMRSQFATGAVRDAMQGKGLPSMIPPCAIRAMAKRFEDGASKYGALNFTKGIPLSRFHDSIMRHLLAWSEGDTTEAHDGAVLWNMAVAMWTLQEIRAGRLPSELNDLPYWKA